jgi:hypothetical protein
VSSSCCDIQIIRAPYPPFFFERGQILANSKMLNFPKAQDDSEDSGGIDIGFD